MAPAIRFPLLVLLLLVCLGAPATVAAGPNQTGRGSADGPTRLELSGARHRLEELEKKVQRARGQPMRIGPIETEGLQRIWSLHERFPNHPEVKDMFQRAQRAVMASKGELTDLPADALAYRDTEKKLQATFADVADREWTAFRQRMERAGGWIETPFPPPSHRETAMEEMTGKLVALDNFFYPANQFMDSGREFVSVGGGLRGYYFVEISNRAWLGAYEAVKRYRRFVNRDMPDDLGWTLIGRITGLDMLIPQAGEHKTIPPTWGWVVEPVAIRVPGRTFTLAQPELELGGQFAGEARLEEIKSSMYSIRAVPADATPEQVTEIFITAIKEKNYPLYLECIEPAYRKTTKALDLCMYHWDWHQHRFATFYCHVKINPARIRVTKGVDDNPDNIENRFLTPEQRAELQRRSGQTVREAELTTQAFDEHGKQYGSLKPRYLRKTDDGRWYILNYAQPF